MENTIPTSFDKNRGIFDLNGDVVYSRHRVTAMAALGTDKTAGFGFQMAPRVGVALPILKSTVVKASWGHAYNVPSFYALSEPVVGNPRLAPEKIGGVDAGAQHDFRGKLTVSVTYYHDRFSDLIDFGSAKLKLVNRSTVVTRGAEASISCSAGHRS